MPRLDDLFADLRTRGRTALMPFVTAGHPSLEATEAALVAMAEAGANVVELGIPFSDPIADGPVIAASMHEALEAGVTPDDVFALVARVRPKLAIGLVAMVSCSIVDRTGAEAFIRRCSEAGFDGLIVPDADLDRAEELSRLAGEYGIGFSLLVAPTTSAARRERIVRLCRGFVYLLARVGITGEREAAPDVKGPVAEIRALTELPIAVGFGISKPEHVAAVTAEADAAIVGSALVRRMAETDAPAEAAGAFVATLARGLASR